MKNKSYRSIVVNLKLEYLYLVLDACLLLGKNIYNASLFLLHNIISSYSYDKNTKSYILKDNLHNNQIALHYDLRGINSQAKYNLKQKHCNNHQTISVIWSLLHKKTL